MLTINKKAVKWYKIVPTFFLMPSMPKSMSVHRMSENIKIMSKSVKKRVILMRNKEHPNCVLHQFYVPLSAKPWMPVLCNIHNIIDIH